MELLRIQILLSNDMCMMHQTRMRCFAQEKVEVDIKALLAMGDLAHGEKVVKKCSACHQIASDG